MMVLDVKVCQLNWWGTILFVFTVGGLLYSTPAWPKHWTPEVSRWRNQSCQSSDDNLEAYWLGGRNSSPKRLQAQRIQLEGASC